VVWECETPKPQLAADLIGFLGPTSVSGAPIPARSSDA
jgi:hypothetical protein